MRTLGFSALVATLGLGACSSPASTTSHDAGAAVGDDGPGSDGAVDGAGDSSVGDSGSGSEGGRDGSVTSDAGDAAAPHVPTDPTGTTALRIADLMGIFGANVYSDRQDGASGETVAGLTAVKQYLVGDSGLSMIFRGYVGSASDYSTFGPSLFEATGCPFTLCMGVGNTPDPSGVITLAQSSVSADAGAAAGWVKLIEGGNEPNTNFGAATQTGVTPAAELSAMQSIYASVHPLGIPVASASVVGSYSGIATYWGADLSGAVAVTDRYNTHLYPNNGGPNGADQLHDWSVAVSAQDWSNKSGIITEWQPVLYNSEATDDDSCAYWTPIMLLSGFVDFHVQAIVWWGLFDYPGFTPHVGLFDDNASQPYPAANAIKAMYGLTGDSGSARHTFAPGKLDVTVTGLPSGANQYAGGRYAVFQNSTPGTFFVFVWNEQNALATATTTPVTVTFNAGSMTKVVDFSLTNPASASPTAIQTLSQASQVKMNLTTEVRLLQVTHP
jgi:hypothetical protein